MQESHIAREVSTEGTISGPRLSKKSGEDGHAMKEEGEQRISVASGHSLYLRKNRVTVISIGGWS
jgi:hypothetical protein